MSWRECTIGEVVHFQRGHDLPDQNRKPGEIPVIGSAGPNGWHNEAKVKGPGVSIGRSGASIGKVTYTPTDYWPHNACLYVTDFLGNDPRFIYYFLKTKDLTSLNSGAAQPSLNRNFVHTVPVRVPGGNEQAAIADILSAYDGLIETNRRRIALLEEAARLLYREWFVHFRFPGHEHVPLTEGLPEGWEVRYLSDLCDPKDGIQTGPFGSQLHQSDYSETGVPVVMPKDMKGFRVESEGIARIPEELADKLGRHRMAVGDTVYGRRGDIGRRAYIGKRQEGFFCGTGCLRIRPIPSRIDPRYLFDALGTPQVAGFIANQAKGSTMPNLSAGALKKVPIPCAPMRLQRLYVEAVEPQLELMETLVEQNQKLAQGRDLLLPRLMNGEIAV